LSFLRQLWRFGARQQNTKQCVYSGRAWAQLACNLQTSVAQAILHRIPTGGHPPAKRTPIEVSVVSGLREQIAESQEHASPGGRHSEATDASHIGTQVSFSPLRSFSLSSLSSHVGTQVSPTVREDPTNRGLLERKVTSHVGPGCCFSSSFLSFSFFAFKSRRNTGLDTLGTGGSGQARSLGEQGGPRLSVSSFFCLFRFSFFCLFVFHCTPQAGHGPRTGGGMSPR